MLSTTALIVSTIVGFVLPLVSDLSTRFESKPELAGIVTAGSSVVSAVAAQAIAQGSHLDWKAIAFTAGSTYLAAAQARARIWLGSVTSDKLKAVGSNSAIPAGVPVANQRLSDTTPREDGLVPDETVYPDEDLERIEAADTGEDDDRDAVDPERPMPTPDQ